MRILIRLLVVLAVIWCGWWALASYGASKAVTAWVEARRADGWDIQADTAQAGFPLNIQTNLNALNLLNPASQSRLKVNGGALKVRTFWPGYVDLDLPDTPITLDLPAGQLALKAKDATVALRLRPGLALEFASLRINSEGWRVEADGNELMVSDDLTLLAEQDAGNPSKYALTLATTDLAPGATLRQILSLPDSWPNSFEAFTATGSVTLDAPLTRKSLETTQPQVRGFSVQEADIIWGALALRASGDLKISDAGVPAGQINLQARNWRELLDLAENAGALPHDMHQKGEIMLALLANRSGRPEDMDLDLTFQDGQMALSGIPLGQAPRFNRN